MEIRDLIILKVRQKVALTKCLLAMPLFVDVTPFEKMMLTTMYVRLMEPYYGN